MVISETKQERNETRTAAKNGGVLRRHPYFWIGLIQPQPDVRIRMKEETCNASLSLAVGSVSRGMLKMAYLGKQSREIFYFWTIWRAILS